MRHPFTLMYAIVLALILCGGLPRSMQRLGQVIRPSRKGRDVATIGGTMGTPVRIARLRYKGIRRLPAAWVRRR